MADIKFIDALKSFDQSRMTLVNALQNIGMPITERSSLKSASSVAADLLQVQSDTIAIRYRIIILDEFTQEIMQMFTDLEDGTTITLPTPPDHTSEGYTFREWTSTQEIINNTVTIAKNDIILAAHYTRTDEKFIVTVNMNKVTGLTQYLRVRANSSTDPLIVYWGDGTSDTVSNISSSNYITHTYANYGIYEIELVADKIIFNSYPFRENTGTSTNDYNYSVIKIDLNGSYAPGSYFADYLYALKQVFFENIPSTISFSNCIALQAIVFPANLRFQYIQFSRNEYLKYVVVPFGMKHWLDLSYSRRLEYIAIPNSVTSWNNVRGAFAYCDLLRRLVIPEGITSLPNSLFRDCTSLQQILLPGTLQSIGEYCFSGCDTLRNVIIPNSVQTIGDRAFSNCPNLLSITFPDSITSLGSGVLSQSYCVRSVILPSHITAIRGDSFYQLYGLDNIIVPINVTHLYSGAFRDTNITTIKMPATLQYLGTNVFQSCWNLDIIDCTNCMVVPTLEGSGRIDLLPGQLKIVVPDLLYDNWVSETNWTALTNYIYKASEVNIND